MLSPAPLPHDDPAKKKIIVVYVFFGLSLFLGFLPFMAAAGLSGLMMLGALIAAYAIRKKTAAESLADNHMTFIIRTIWIGGALASVTMLGAGLYLFNALDNTPLNPCIGNLTPEAAASAASVNELFGECYNDYWRANLTVFIIAGAAGILPVAAYFLIRYARGFSRALGGYRIAKPQSWF